MIEPLILEFSNAKLVSFLRSQNSSFVDYEEELSDIVSDFEKFDNLIKLGEIEYADTDTLLVFTCLYNGELSSRSARKTQFEIAKKALTDDFKTGAVFVFYDVAGRFRFSFIRRNYGDKNQKFTPWKRYTYFVEPDAKTNRTFIERIGACKLDSLDNIQQAFSVEKLTKDFYKELSDWYFWAIKNVTFPNDITDDSDDEKYNSENVIRLITRLIFVWFLKQKGLIRNELFEPNALSEILKDFDAESETQNNYYRAILQNLFFATLNQEIGQRGFAEDKGFVLNRDNNTIKNLYRYEKEFQNSATQVMELFSQVPFLNGGLFECLDRKEKDGNIYDWDGFSRNPKYQASIPNALFFAKDSKVDLSAEYNDKKLKAVKVAGIIEILNRYNFTVEENTPVEVEVALDPELLGKVFENLLGAFNPETQETARKQTGSFYTPREIVNYMVDESLIAYFQTKVPEMSEDALRYLFSYDEEIAEVDDTQRESLIQAAFDCKILDPACGSGAFPMGILQQMVHVLKKLDPDNTHWNNVVMAQAMKDFHRAENNSEYDLEERKKDIEETFVDGLNHPDYVRKLHVIENCIYGVDIQSIAVQISKLRFFISLVCEQGKNPNPNENFGIRPLPNLETKFVAANTLIGIEKNEEDMILFRQNKILKLVEELKEIRHRQFLVTNAQKKKDLRKKDETLRHSIVTEVQKLYVKRANEDLFQLRMQLKQSEKELEALNNKTDIIQTYEELSLFGSGKKKTVNVTENKRSELRTLIARLNRQITDGSKYTRLESVVTLANQLTSWNPYDQNDSSPFFDPEWMFGLPKQNNGYFDVVIGNPPYIDIKGLPKKDVKLYFDIFTTTENRINIYSIFIEKGISILNDDGVLTFINPNSILVNESYRKIRRHLVDGVEKIIKLPDSVFETATVETIILVAKKKTLSEYIYGLYFANNDKISFANLKFNLFSREEWRNDEDSRFNIFGNNEITQIIDKIHKQGIALENFVEISLGITPYDKYQGHSEETIKNREYHSLKKLSNDYVPLISGKNIHPYIITDEISEYLKYGDWLGAPREKKFFESSKIVVRQITGGKNLNIIAAYSEKPHYFTQIGFSLISRNRNDNELKFILSLLNSKLMCFYHKKKFLDPEKITFQKILIANCKKLPIKLPENKTNFISITDEIIKLRTNNQIISILELEDYLNSIIYRLYDLTYSEVKIIDPEIENKISEVKYNAINID